MNSDLSDACANAPAMLPNGWSHGLPTTRTATDAPCPWPPSPPARWTFLAIVDGDDCREIEERYLENGECASIRPPPRGGCRPKEDGLWIARTERKERAAGGSTACGRGCRLSHGPSAEGLILLLRCEVVLAATAARSTPPVAAPASCLLPCIRLPFMAAPPPLSEGGGACCPPCALHSWDSGGGSTIIPEEPHFASVLSVPRHRALPNGPGRHRIGGMQGDEPWIFC